MAINHKTAPASDTGAPGKRGGEAKPAMVRNKFERSPEHVLSKSKKPRNT